MTQTKKTAVFTIVSLNYGAFAKTLMSSLQNTHPDWDRHVLFVDRSENEDQLSSELFTAHMVETLPLPKKNEFLFRYGIMELNTAAKPYMFTHLRQLGYEHIIYIDPDIYVFDRLVDVENLLNEGATAVVTPHLTSPITDEKVPSELDIMRAGAYNLGFLALGNQAASDQFITWWEQKLEYGAVSDPAKGLFTDQKWVDLAPGMFGGFAILRDPGYNLAYWNIAQRPVTFANQQWLVNDKPLRFFHYSGFDPLNPKPFSKHQDRLTLETIGQAKELALFYAEKVKEHGLVESRKQKYAFGQFSDGLAIPNCLRVLFRESADVRFQAGENPFESSHFFLHAEIDQLPLILRAVWMEHQHLQRAFPDPLGANRIAYYHWFAEAGGVEIGIPEAFILPIRASLKELQQSVNQDPNNKPLISQMENYRPSIWARGLVFLHKRLTSGKLSHERLTQYQQVTSFIDFFQLGMQQFRISKWAHKIGLGISSNKDPLKIYLPYNTRTATSSFQQSRRHAAKFSGLYAEKNQHAWWVGRQARFIVKQAVDTKIRIQGIVHGSLLQTVNGQEDLKISIGWNELTRKEVILKSGNFDVEFNVEEQPQQWPATLHIIPSCSFVPKELNINEDTRRLSFQLSLLSFGDIPFFNASEQFQETNISQIATPGVNVIGYARSEHGVGQSLRQFTSALKAKNMTYAVIDFNKNNLSRVQDLSSENEIVEEPVHEINVFHINADQMSEAEMHLPSHFFSRYNIGFWHWELPEMLDEHLSGFNMLNEIWVPTGFVQEAIAKRSPIPVVRMPHAIHFEVSPNANRAQFGLPENNFLFLMMYDFSSYQERKNPQATIDAFNLAFPNSEEKIGLVIKTQNAHHHPKDAQALKDHLANRQDIYWINETLTRQEVYDLQSVCDSLVSLHRSEGYGLGPAEAMFLGKPVIATNWSGNTEFMRPQNSLPVDFSLIKITEDIGVYKAGQTWANPDIHHAAQLMKKVVNDEEFRNRIGMAARRTMIEEYSPEKIAVRIQQRLQFIQSQIMQS